MNRSRWLSAAAALALLGSLGIEPVEAQQAGSATALQPKPAPAGQQTQPGTAVENSVPASPHQQGVLRPDDGAAQGQNMTTTGPAGQGSAETQHQQQLLKPQSGGQAQ